MQTGNCAGRLMPACGRYSQIGAAVFLSAKAGLAIVATRYDVQWHVVEVGAPPAGHG